MGRRTAEHGGKHSQCVSQVLVVTSITIPVARPFPHLQGSETLPEGYNLPLLGSNCSDMSSIQLFRDSCSLLRDNCSLLRDDDAIFLGSYPCGLTAYFLPQRIVLRYDLIVGFVSAS
jgi:hypothetical protein